MKSQKGLVLLDGVALYPRFTTVPPRCATKWPKSQARGSKSRSVSPEIWAWVPGLRSVGWGLLQPRGHQDRSVVSVDVLQ